MPSPFTSRSCETCLQQGKGDYILLNLNNGIQHAESHHSGVQILYLCNTCKTSKNKHAAQCHAPKYKSLSRGEGKNTICGICKQVFNTQRGVSQHERLVHLYSGTKNEKKLRRTGRIEDRTRGMAVFSKDVKIMIRLEKTLQRHPRIAQQMKQHPPGNEAKQIRDKRREPSYQVLVAYNEPLVHATATEPPESTRSGSDKETDTCAENRGRDRRPKNGYPATEHLSLCN
jgi:hypothetical protein